MIRLMIFLGFICSTLWASAENQPDEQETDAQTEEQTQAEQIKDDGADSSRQEFIPSEQISADNSVPFPTDI